MEDIYTLVSAHHIKFYRSNLIASLHNIGCYGKIILTVFFIKDIIYDIYNTCIFFHIAISRMFNYWNAYFIF